MPAGINVATGTNVCGWDEKFPGNFSTASYTYSTLVNEKVLSKKK